MDLRRFGWFMSPFSVIYWQQWNIICNWWLCHWGWLHNRSMPTGPTGYKKPWLRLHLGFLVLRCFIQISVFPYLRKWSLQRKSVGDYTSRLEFGLSRCIAVRQPLAMMHILILMILLYYVLFPILNCRFVIIVMSNLL